MSKNICICNKIIKTINYNLINNILMDINKATESKGNYERLINCDEFTELKNKLYNENNILVYVNKTPFYNNQYKVTWNKSRNKIIVDLY